MSTLLVPKIRPNIVEDLKKDIDDKEAIIGHAYLNFFIRSQYLSMVDSKWLDHLENMEALREAVYLRSYAQKNPLTEYKVEGFQIFETMIEDIRQAIASRLHLIRIQTAENRETRVPARLNVQPVNQNTATHSSVSSFSAASSGRKEPARMQSETATIVRSQPKTGRNDPCPCGSGKKYKYCHGK